MHSKLYKKFTALEYSKHSNPHEKIFIIKEKGIVTNNCIIISFTANDESIKGAVIHNNFIESKAKSKANLMLSTKYS